MTKPSAEKGRVAPNEMVVVGSWVTQKVQGGAISVDFDGQLVGELLNKKYQFRVTSPPPGTTVKIRVRTTGVSRRHRKATFTFNVEPVASQGVLVIVSCAVGYLWPLVGSKPARVRVVQGSDLEVPKSRGGAWASNINRMRAWDTFSPPTDTANHPTPIDAVLGGLRGSVVPGDPHDAIARR